MWLYRRSVPAFEVLFPYPRCRRLLMRSFRFRRHVFGRRSSSSYARKKLCYPGYSFLCRGHIRELKQQRRRRRRRRRRLRKRHLKREVARSQTQSRLFHLVWFVNCGQFFWSLILKGLYQRAGKEKESCFLVFPSSTKREIRHLHVCSRATTAKK